MKTQTIAFLLAFLVTSSLFAQNEQTDTVKSEVKKGWNMGVLPALGYDSNLGMLYGGIVNLFDYGDGTRYPDYNHNLYLQLSAYTKGSMDAIAYFDSYTLIPEKHFTARLSFNRNQAYPFYGLNGANTNYNSDLEDKTANDYLTSVFYRYDRSLVKADVILQDKIADTHFNWMAGADLGWYDISEVNVDKLNENADDEELIPTGVENLYDKYVAWGLISEEEKNGGFDNSLKVGLVYDTRDRLTNPMKGIWTEAILRGSPKFLGNEENFGRFSLIHRQYFTIVKEKLSFAYRLWYEQAFGNTPFYSAAYLTTSNYFEGFGGANTMRGLLMNRVAAKSSAIGNFELRWKALPFRLMNQNFYLGLNAFVDAGKVFKGYDLDMTNVSATDQATYFSNDYKNIFSTAGAGLKLVMNENFVISADYAKSFDENYGPGGMYVLVGYMF